MADNRYFGGITIGAAGFEVASPNPVDSRFRVKNQEGLAEITSLYEGLISYVESNKTYYQYTNGEWKALSINSAEELEALIKGYIATETTGAMEFKGATATLPENPSKGDMWKVAGSNINITVDDVAAKTGDTVIYNGEAWVLIPSGDDIEDTWRPIIAAGNTLETDETFELIAGENVSITELDGKVTISSADTDTHHEAKIIIGNDTTDVSTDENVDNGNVHLNVVENGELRSSHKIVGINGVEVKHLTAGSTIHDPINSIDIPVEENTIFVGAETVKPFGDESGGGIQIYNADGTVGQYLHLSNSNDISVQSSVDADGNSTLSFYAGSNIVSKPELGFWEEDGSTPVEDFTQTTVKDYIDDNLNKLSSIAKTGNVADLVQTENTYVVFNCGSSSTVI